MIQIGSKIKELRKSKKLSQEQFAEKFNVSTGAVCKWENNSNYPDIEKIVEIAKYFNVSVDYILAYNTSSISLEEFLKYLKSETNSKKYNVSVEEVKKYITYYPNNFKLINACAEYLDVYALEKNEDNLFDYVMSLYYKSIDLFNQNTNKNITIRDIQSNIIHIMSVKKDYQKCIDYIEENGLSSTHRLALGTSYYGLNEIKKGFKHLSYDFLDIYARLSNLSVTMFSNYIEQKRYDDAIEFFEIVKDFSKRMIKTKNCFLYNFISILSVSQATVICLFLNKSYDYKYYLEESKKYNEEVVLPISYDTNSLKFCDCPNQIIHTKLVGDIHKTNIQTIKEFSKYGDVTNLIKEYLDMNK